MTRWVLLLSDSVEPHPSAREIPGLLADFALNGETYVATRQVNIRVGAEVGELALIDGTGRVLAVASYTQVHGGAPPRVPGVYAAHPLIGANRWFQLTNVVALGAGADLDVLGWTRHGEALTTENRPMGQGGLAFTADP